MEEDHHSPTLQLQTQGHTSGGAPGPLWGDGALTVWMKQCSLSSCAYSTLSLMNTEMALRMNDTNRFMWMKLRVQCSFLQQDRPALTGCETRASALFLRR